MTFADTWTNAQKTAFVGVIVIVLAAIGLMIYWFTRPTDSKPTLTPSPAPSKGRPDDASNETSAPDVDASPTPMPTIMAVDDTTPEPPKRTKYPYAREKIPGTWCGSSLSSGQQNRFTFYDDSTGWSIFTNAAGVTQAKQITWNTDGLNYVGGSAASTIPLEMMNQDQITLDAMNLTRCTAPTYVPPGTQSYVTDAIRSLFQVDNGQVHVKENPPLNVPDNSFLHGQWAYASTANTEKPTIYVDFYADGTTSLKNSTYTKEKLVTILGTSQITRLDDDHIVIWFPQGDHILYFMFLARQKIPITPAPTTPAPTYAVAPTLPVSTGPPITIPANYIRYQAQRPEETGKFEGKNPYPSNITTDAFLLGKWKYGNDDVRFDGNKMTGALKGTFTLQSVTLEAGLQGRLTALDQNTLLLTTEVMERPKPNTPKVPFTIFFRLTRAS